MNVRTIMTRVRHGQLSTLTYSQLQIAALRAFPSSPLQKTIIKEMEARRAAAVVGTAEAGRQ